MSVWPIHDDGSSSTAVLAASSSPRNASYDSSRWPRFQPASACSRRVCAMTLHGSANPGSTRVASSSSASASGEIVPVHVPEALDGQVPRRQVLVAFPHDAARLFRCQLRRDAAEDLGDDLGLHAGELGASHVVPRGPELRVRRRIQELDAQTAGSPGAHEPPRHRVAGAQRGRARRRLEARVSLVERGIAGQDRKPAPGGELGDQLLRDAVGEVGVFGGLALRALRLERQHGENRTRQHFADPRCAPRTEKTSPIRRTRPSPTNRKPCPWTVLMSLLRRRRRRRAPAAPT